MSFPFTLIAKTGLLAPTLALCLGGGGPQITALSDATLERSGRLTILGTAFGSAQGTGEVRVDGSPAIVSTWSDSEIHAYVPEAASLGAVAVQVVTSGGTSNSVSLTVSSRQADGRIRWSFQLDSDVVLDYRQVIGKDGTTYASAGDWIYALSPAGALLWASPTGGPRAAMAAGLDGSIYTAHFSTLYAHRPDGSLKWTRTFAGTQGVIAGPSVGPDGNVYGAVSTVPSGIGVFCLDPDNNLLWSDPGSPGVHWNGGGGQEIAFGADRFYLSFKVGQGTTPPAIWCFDYDGDQVFYLGTGCETVPGLQPNGDFVVGNEACGVTARDPDASVSWNTATPGSGWLQIPAIGPDGSIYTAQNWTRFWALNPDGSTRWSFTGGNGVMRNLGVAPDNSAVLDGGQPDFGETGWVRAYAPADGSLLWQVDLPAEPGGGYIITHNRPAFTSDSQTAYYTASVFGVSGVSHGYVFAINTSSSGSPAFGLAQDPLVHGQSADFTVTGAGPGERVYFLYSLAGVGNGPCTPKLGGLCLDLLQPISLLGDAVANASGTAVLTVNIPPSVPAISVHTQAVVRRGPAGADSVETNAVSSVIQ